LRSTTILIVFLLLLFSVQTAIAVPFNSTWNTELLSTGSSATSQIKLPLESTGTYNFSVDWGDGNNSIITAWNQAEVTHTYASGGIYNISIDGTLNGWRFAATGDRLKITDISNWGNLLLGDNGKYFDSCTNMCVSANDAIDVKDMTNFERAFFNCDGLTSINTTDWDTSSVKSFLNTFSGCHYLTAIDVSKWDVRNVEDYGGMFSLCQALTVLDVSNWETDSGISYTFMLNAVPVIELNVTNFNATLATNFYCTFRGTDIEYLDVSKWNTLNVNSYREMFRGSDIKEINGIGDLNISSVTTFFNMFTICTLNTSTYDEILSHWQPSAQTQSFAVGSTYYSLIGEYGRNKTLMLDNGWLITDMGLEASYPATSLHYNLTNPYFHRVESDSDIYTNKPIISNDATGWTATSTNATYHTYWNFTSSINPSGTTSFIISGEPLDSFTVTDLTALAEYAVNDTNSQLGTFSTDVNGNATFTIDLPKGNYNIFETSPPVFYNVSGFITSEGSGIFNVLVSNNQTSGTVYTDSSGYYFLENLQNGSINITGILAGYVTNHTVVNLVGFDLANQNFTMPVCTNTFSLSGYVKDIDNVSIYNASVKINNILCPTIYTDINGFYSFICVCPGNHTINVNKLYYIENSTDIFISEDIENQNMTLIYMNVTNVDLWKKLIDIETGIYSLEDEDDGYLSLPEVCLLIAFFAVVRAYRKDTILPVAALFYSLWFYSTQIDHSQEYAYFLTASFFCIWVGFIFVIYERSGNVQKENKNRR